MNEIVARINELRVKNGLSKASLAKLTGVTPTTVSNWSNKGYVPSLDVIERVCVAVGIPFESFFVGLGKTENENAESDFINEWRFLTDEQKKTVSDVIDTFNLPKKEKVL